MDAFSVGPYPKTEKWREEYIAVGFVNTVVNCFNSTEGSAGILFVRTSSRNLEWREMGRKELGHDICSPNQKMEQETRAWWRRWGPSHDLCGS